MISIAIIPQYRRMGIATSLLLHLEERARAEGLKSIFLEVRVMNYPGIFLYKKLGYKIMDVLKGYYRDGEDAYLMEKTL